jgi:hypothetical protein
MRWLLIATTLGMGACGHDSAPSPQAQRTPQRQSATIGSNPTESKSDDDEKRVAEHDAESTESEKFFKDEREFLEHRTALMKVLSDPTFADQHAALQALMRNADLIRQEHVHAFPRATAEGRKEAASHHFWMHWEAMTALFQVRAVFDGLPHSSKSQLIDRMQGFRNHYDNDLKQFRPVVESFSRAGLGVRARYEALNDERPEDLPPKLDESIVLFESVPSYLAADDAVSAYIVQRNATLLMDAVRFGLAPYYVDVYQKSRPANP